MNWFGCLAFIAKEDMAAGAPSFEQGGELQRLSDLWHECAATLLCCLDGVGAQAVRPQALRIGEACENGLDAGSPHLGRFFHDEICASLFDRSKEEPEIGRILLESCLLFHLGADAAFARLDDPRGPCALATIEYLDPVSNALPHDACEVVRLCLQQQFRTALERRVKIEPDFRTRLVHKALEMTVPDHNPAAPPDASKDPLTADGRVADATEANWVDRFAPRWARPYLRLSRADRPAGTWLLLIPCWWGLALAVASDPSHIGPHTGWIALGCAIGAFLMRGAGCTWNDITDRDFDGAVARTKSRPIPSGQVSVKGAAIWMIVQSLLAFCILLTFQPLAIWLGIGSLALVAIYPFAKRFTWWPQVFLGLAFNWGALLASAAYAGEITDAALLLYGAGIAWTLFYDTIYAHQDKEDDALIGVKSTARLFGDASGRWLFGFLVIAVSLMGMAALMALITQPPVALLLGIGAAWGFGWHMAGQMRQLDVDNPDNCLRIFRSNRDAGLIPVAGFCLAAAASLML